MKKTITACLISLTIVIAFLGCNDQQKNNTAPDRNVSSNIKTTPAEKPDPNSARVVFDITLDQRVYEDSSNFGEPPQVAIWLENQQTSKIKTLWVTYRSASGDWVGKVQCPVSLPYWFSRYNKETNTTKPPSFMEPAPLAITRPTPKTSFKVEHYLKEKTTWQYFIEVNVSADFNATFSSETSMGRPDPHGNGQPSIIYKGTIDTTKAMISQPELIGRTDQFYITDKINPDLTKITSAKNLIKDIKLTYHKPQTP